MKSILFLLLLSSSLLGQGLYKPYYQYKLDSISMCRSIIDLNVNQNLRHNNILKLTHYGKVKLTVKSLSTNNNMHPIQMENASLEQVLEQYISMGMYDVLLKARIRHIRILGRVIVSGFDARRYSYQSGLILKF